MIIVTGATGFIGSNIVADLNAAWAEATSFSSMTSVRQWQMEEHREDADFRTSYCRANSNALLSASSPGGDVVYHMGANSSTTVTDGDAILRSATSAPRKSWWEWCAANPDTRSSTHPLRPPMAMARVGFV